MTTSILSFFTIRPSIILVILVLYFLLVGTVKQLSAVNVHVVGWHTTTSSGPTYGYDISGGDLVSIGMYEPPATCDTITKGYFTYTCNEESGYYEYVSGSKMNGQPIRANDGSILNIAGIDLGNDNEVQAALDDFYGACESPPCPVESSTTEVHVVGWETQASCGNSSGYDIRCGDLVYIGVYGSTGTCATITKGYFTYTCNEESGYYEYVSGSKMNGQPIRANDGSILNIAGIDLGNDNEVQAALDSFYGVCKRIIREDNLGPSPTCSND